MLILSVLSYAVAIMLANIMVSIYGPGITPITAFIFIGFDLSMRDFLNVKLNNGKMIIVIFTTGIITFLIAPNAKHIAIASAISFVISAIIDWLVFRKTEGSFLRRSNYSNIAGAAVDSIVFPYIAFGALMPEITIMQFMAKSSGGAIWAYLLNKAIVRRAI